MKKRRILASGFSLFALASWLMVPASFIGDTSFGFDVRLHDGPDQVDRQYQLRWPGDGSFRIGRDRVRRPIFEPLDWWAWEGRLFSPPVRRARQTGWNRLGFWWVNEQATDGVEIVDESWIAVPSWLPAVVFLGVWVRFIWWPRQQLLIE